jgi:hypothetical protein
MICSVRHKDASALKPAVRAELLLPLHPSASGSVRRRSVTTRASLEPDILLTHYISIVWILLEEIYPKLILLLMSTCLQLDEQYAANYKSSAG